VLVRGNRQRNGEIEPSMFFTSNKHVLQPLLEQAKAELKNGAVKKETLLLLAQKLIAHNPAAQFYVSNPDTYSVEEKSAAVTLLKENGLGQFCNFSPRYKHKLLSELDAKLKGEILVAAQC
jgi:hypothetical protein